MYELETLVVPKELGEWLQYKAIGESGAYFSTIGAMYRYLETVAFSPTGDFIVQNKKELIEVIIGSRGYRVEKEQKYYVLDSENIPLLEKVNNQTCKTTTGLSIYEDGRDNSSFELTEQEIKDYDERFLVFAEPIEQVDFRLSF